MEEHGVILRPATADDFDWMDVIDDLRDWRGDLGIGGVRTRPDRHAAAMWHRVVVSAGEPVGYVTAYRHGVTTGTVWLGVATVPSTSDGIGLLGAGLAINELFDRWGIRRVLFETSTSRLGQYLSLLEHPWIQRHGTLRELLGPTSDGSGDWWIFSIEREVWGEAVHDLVHDLAPRIGRRAGRKRR